jgi:hypothetical protein
LILMIEFDTGAVYCSLFMRGFVPSRLPIFHTRAFFWNWPVRVAVMGMLVALFLQNLLMDRFPTYAAGIGIISPYPAAFSSASSFAVRLEADTQAGAGGFRKPLERAR